MAAMRHCCATLLAAIKVEVQFGGMGMWRHGGGVVSDGMSWPWCRFCHAVHVQLGVGMLWAKALAIHLLTVMAAASSDVVLPVGGIIFEPHPPLFGYLGKSPV